MRDKFNYETIEGEVTVQYNDMKGLAALDGHGIDSLYNMCRDNGINMDDYYLLGVGFYDSGTEGIFMFDSVSIHVLLIDKNEYASDTYDDLAQKLSQEAEVHAIRKSFRVKLGDLHKYFKRFDCLALTDMSSNIKRLNIEEQ